MGNTISERPMAGEVEIVGPVLSEGDALTLTARIDQLTGTMDSRSGRA